MTWRCGVSRGRARTLVAMARRLGELPETKAALEAGELAEDQVAVICRHAPTDAEASVADFARYATVSQLRRVLVDYTWDAPGAPDRRPEERRRVSFGHRDDGSWRLWASLPADEGALVEMALDAARQSMWAEADTPEARHELAWPDALVAMADRSLAPGARPQRDRHTVLVHVRDEGEGPTAHLHLGPHLPDALRRYLGCDASARAVIDRNGVATSVGRALRIVPERTRIAVGERDRGCRMIPGCDATKGLEVHHLIHWEDGGGTDTANLVCGCRRHHRQHHLGLINITGNADDPDGLSYTDHRGRRLTGRGRPAPPPPGHRPITGNWVHPSGERLDGRWVCFPEPTLT